MRSKTYEKASERVSKTHEKHTGNRSKTHAADRARERYGIELSPAEFGDVVRRIASGSSILLAKRLPDGTERHLVNVKGVDMIALWRPDIRRLMTILPMKARLPRLKRFKFRNGGEGKRPERAYEYLEELEED